MLRQSGMGIIESSTGDPVFLNSINLGGWLEWEGYIFGNLLITYETQIMNGLTTLIGSGPAATFQQTIWANMVTESDIAKIAELGFNCVRVAFNHRLFDNFYSNPSNPTPDPTDTNQLGWGIIDNIMSWCTTYGVYVILDMHAPPGGQLSGYGPGDYTAPGLWASTNYLNCAYAIWGALANRYANETILAGYDLCNEPQAPTGSQLATFYTNCISAIRAHDTNHMVICEGNAYATDFSWVTTPPDSNMMYSFHQYLSSGLGLAQPQLAAYQQLAIAQNVPMWCGEFGLDYANRIGIGIDYFETSLPKISWVVGWAQWTWKMVQQPLGVYNQLNTITASSNWSAIMNWIVFGGTQPSGSVVSQGVTDFENAVLLANCAYDPRVSAQFYDYPRLVYAGIPLPYSTGPPNNYWRLNEATGTNAADSANSSSAQNNGTYGASLTLGEPGIPASGPGSLNDTAVLFSGSDQIETSTENTSIPLNNFYEEIWFKTTSQGGILQFANSQAGTPTSYDRMFYVGTDNKLYYACFALGYKVLSSVNTVTDGSWHHAVGVVQANHNMQLWLDGAMVASNTNTSQVGNFSGWWRIGYAYTNAAGWTNHPSAYFFTGTLAQVSWGAPALVPAQIVAHYRAGKNLPQLPLGNFSAFM
jgi:hypothetical protein